MPETNLLGLYKNARSAAEKSDSMKKWIEYGFEDVSFWVETRQRCYTDLFWFATEILDYDLVEAHRPICEEFFLKKDPNIPIYELSKQKSRLILYPRGSFKSSIDEADTVQWIICYPNIRIGLMTAVDNLALAFVRNVKSFFQIADKATLTKFQMLFIEHCVKASKREDAAIFTTRARTKKLAQATLEALSLMASTSGTHYDVGKFDDVVSNKNSGPGSTPETRRKVFDAIRFAAALVEPFGYRFYIGTPYDADDAWSLLQNKIKNLTILRKPALLIKESARSKKFFELTEDEVELLFPADKKGVPRLTLEFLQNEYEADEYIFNCNYMLDPQRTHAVRFTEDMIRNKIMQSSGLPQAGTYKVFSAWDFADSTGRQSDYSVGVAGFLDVFGRLFIVEIVRDKFTPSELAFQVAKLAAKWRVERMYIEKSPGADFLQNDIVRELTRQGYGECPLPEWFPVDNQKGAKLKRAEMIESYLTHGTIWFSSEIPIMGDVIQEFCNFKPDSKRKDDIIDAIAHLCRVMPAKIELPATEKEQTDIVMELLARKQLHEMYFGVREAIQAQPVEDVPLTAFEGAPVVCPHCGCSPCLGA